MSTQPLTEATWNDPLGDETEPAHSIQVGAYESEGLSCICGFTPRGDGTHALTNHLMAEALRDAAQRVKDHREHDEPGEDQHWRLYQEQADCWLAGLANTYSPSRPTSEEH